MECRDEGRSRVRHGACQGEHIGGDREGASGDSRRCRARGVSRSPPRIEGRWFGKSCGNIIMTIADYADHRAGRSDRGGMDGELRQPLRDFSKRKPQGFAWRVGLCPVRCRETYSLPCVPGSCYHRSISGRSRTVVHVEEQVAPNHIHLGGRRWGRGYLNRNLLVKSDGGLIHIIEP